ncbi:MAG: DUF4252 domain-containing protein [Proteiniphilum sp.]|nr:DUF4252 domain-containing protein [Proteiniphilum sp.]
MKHALLILCLVTLPVLVCASDFVTLFVDRYAEGSRPLNNVNIGKTMLERMAENTSDQELKEAFSKLNSIRIVSSENKRDSKHYFRKAEELVKEAFADYQEVVSINEQNTKISIWMKEMSAEDQDLILLSLDEEGKFSVITVTGNIDFKSIAKLSGSLKNKPGLIEKMN